MTTSISRRKHLVIPDTQCKPGEDLKWLAAIGEYIVDQHPDVVVHLGDHWDMPSLSSYDRGTKSFEGRRYKEDIEAGIEGMTTLITPLKREITRISNNKKKKYAPTLLFCLGNHEQRIMRAIESNAILDGTIGYHDLKLDENGWQVRDFLQPTTLDGVTYCHYAQQPNSSHAIGTAKAIAQKKLGSWTVGHKQGFDYYVHDNLVDNHRVQCIIAGSCYPHQEAYRGHQGNNEWRGLLVKHNVEHGQYDLMQVGLPYLIERFL